ncbi:MAG TPA: glycosyltransferase family 4 protein [Terriglobales bacterium]|nr:glycosyltransferase family 4 protein [Terriglobales bacterium]
MGIYVVSANEGKVLETYERSTRIALICEESEASSFPDPLREASDSIQRNVVEFLDNGTLPENSDGMIVWLAGERLLQGDTAGIRRHLVGTPCRGMVPVHLPCMEELDLISLQPRLVMRGATTDRVCNNIRIAGNPKPSFEVRSALERNAEPWARLHLALLDEMNAPGSGCEALARMWLEKGWHPVLASLVLRNLVVLLLRHDHASEAERLLEQGRQLFQRNAELSYIAALLAANRKKVNQVLSLLRHATAEGDPGFVGSGGERSYRAHWLMARALEPMGEQQTLLHHYRLGLHARPTFEPSIVGLLRQRLSYQSAYRLRLELCPLARREPRYFEGIFFFLLLHRQFKSAERLVRMVPIEEELRKKYRAVYEDVAAAYVPEKKSGGLTGVVLSGPFLILSSLARVNRELGVALLACPELEVGFEPHGLARMAAEQVPEGGLANRGLYQRPRHCDLTVRHHWPPDFERPLGGKLACIFPWEFGAIPKRWATRIETNLDEVWVPSQFVRSVLIRCGVSASRVQVIPYGLNAHVFRPDGPNWLPDAARGCIFLFVGGIIERKGLDVLCEAFLAAFGSGEDVTLVLKDQGSATFYGNSKLFSSIRSLAKKHTGPRVLLLSDELSDEKLAALYRGANAFVLPYRGEGFGMPMAEALACGTPVIATGLGPAREFCPEGSTYFIRAKEVIMPEPPSYLGSLAADCTWFEADVHDLAQKLREVYENREHAKRRGILGSEIVRKALAWDNVKTLYLARIRALTAPSGKQ